MAIEFVFLLATSLVITPLLMIMVYGLVGIGMTDSIRTIIGSLFAGSILSMVITTVANWMLALTPAMAQDNALYPIGVMVKTILAALAQPTVTGVVLLSILCLLSLAVARLSAMFEDVCALVAGHTAYMTHKNEEASKAKKSK